MTGKTKNRLSGLMLWLLAVSCAAFISVSGHGSVYAWECTGTPSQCADYLEAVTSAQGDLTPDKVYTNLTPVTTTNPNLIWKDGVPGSRLLVAAYKYGTDANPPFFACQPGVPFPKDCAVLGSPWVTMVPELLNFFQKNTYSTLRIEQLLGLPPNYGNDWIVEYWANPADLFRPGMDPQTSYREGTVQFPWNSNAFLTMNSGDNAKVWDDYCTISTDPSCTCVAGAQYTDYQCWFQNRRTWVYSYDLSGAPYPWTGLGYTYDWGNSKTVVGLSEFVLNKAPDHDPFIVTIQSVTKASEYLARNQKVTLTVNKSGLGKGSVKSTPSGISCSKNCTSTSKKFNKYADVTLTAKAEKGSIFTGWGEACSGIALTCTIPLTSDLTVTAGFAADTDAAKTGEAPKTGEAK